MLTPIDQSVEVLVTVSGPTISVSLAVWGDVAEYTESIFYTGQMKVMSNRQGAAGTILLPVGGPIRLLTAQLSSTVAGQVTLFITGSPYNLLEIDVATGEASVTFPPDTILPSGDTLSLFQSAAGVSAAQVSYAYP
jgi:hypothetical protein